MIVSDSTSFDKLLRCMKDKYDNLNKECEELRETLEVYDEEEEIRKRDEQIRWLETCALEILSEKEVEDIREFRKAHWASCKNSNDFIYRIFRTGLGNCITVTCPVCKECKDITDASKW